MTITFVELCDLVASSKRVSRDFWKEDPLYIQVGEYTDRKIEESVPYAVLGGPDIVIDINADDQAKGIEFTPM